MIPTTLRATLSLLLFLGALAAADPVANDQLLILPESGGQEYPLEADYSDADTALADLTFTIVSQPRHGTAVTHNLNVPGYKGVLKYTISQTQFDSLPDPPVTSFVWSVSDGTTTAQATVTIVFDDDYNERPQVADQTITCVAGNTGHFKLAWTDREDDPVSVTITTPPAAGSAAVVEGGTHLRFTAPDPFTEAVSVQWKASDAGDSEIATYTIAPPSGDRRVAVIVNQALYDDHLHPEVDRLLHDIANEGWYAPHLVRYAFDGAILDDSNTDAEAIWTILNDLYAEPEGLEGAILIGRLPIPVDDRTGNETHDDAYRHMAAFDTTHESTTDGADIWTSRFFAIKSDGSAYKYGDEVTLLRRGLDHNHAFRTGRTRLPSRAMLYHKTDKSTDNETIDNKTDRFEPVSDRLFDDFLVMRDAAPSNSVECGYTIGGHLFHAAAHATGSGNIDNGKWTFDLLHKTGAQAFFSCHTACALVYGGIFDQHLYTRDGSAVVVMSAGILAWPAVAERLDAGCPIGAAYFDEDRLGLIGITNHGDLTLALHYAPPNVLPTIDNLSVSPSSGEAPLVIDASVTASDSDDAVSWIEWFGQGYDLGRAAPTHSGADATQVQATYLTPGRHTLRVAVFDRYRGMAFKEKTIEVSPNSRLPIRVNGGGPTVLDSQNRRWIANQNKGNWGSSTWRNSDTAEPIPDTPDDAIYQQAICHSSSWRFEMPLASGDYRIALHFADLENGEAGVNVFDIDIEGSETYTDVDPAAEAGGQYQPLVYTHDLTVNDGSLELVFRPDAAASSIDKPNAFLNAIAILPVGADRAPVFTSAPALRAAPEANYTYAITGADNEGDALAFELLDGPAWLTLTDHGDGTASLAGTTPAGEYPISIRLSDGNLSATQSYTLVVATPPSRWRSIAIGANDALGPLPVAPRCDADPALRAIPAGDDHRFDGLTPHEAHSLDLRLLESDG